MRSDGVVALSQKGICRTAPCLLMGPSMPASAPSSRASATTKHRPAVAVKRIEFSLSSPGTANVSAGRRGLILFPSASA